jgi:hypothetical protein
MAFSVRGAELGEQVDIKGHPVSLRACHFIIGQT